MERHANPTELVSGAHSPTEQVARGLVQRAFPAVDYDLDHTFTSGQVFGWRRKPNSWAGGVGRRWVELQTGPHSIIVTTSGPVADWNWLTDYLQLDLDLENVLRTFPQDEPMLAAVAGCRGLRLLRQDPWECLASFILSSTKQIAQIRQITALLCQRYGEPVVVPAGQAPVSAFPVAERLAALEEADLRACKMGFRAPYLLGTARAVASGKVALGALGDLPVEEARRILMQLPGVGRKIADCVLLFAYGFQSAFPVDVWVTKALRELYFPRRRVSVQRLHRFAATHFGPNAGYAQQYLFHFMRTRKTLHP